MKTETRFTLSSNEDQHDDMSHKVELGQIYDIHRFCTKEDSHSFRVLKNEMVLHFNGSTQLDQTSPPIPRHSFLPVEFEHLEKEQQSKERQVLRNRRQGGHNGCHIQLPNSCRS